MVGGRREHDAEVIFFRGEFFPVFSVASLFGTVEFFPLGIIEKSSFFTAERTIKIPKMTKRRTMRAVRVRFIWFS